MDSNTDVDFISSSDPAIGAPHTPAETVVEERDILDLEIDDKEFVRTANDLIRKSEDFYKVNYDLKNRRKRNEKYLFGRQIKDLKLKPYNAKYSYNFIYEAMAYLKPIALSKMPDLMVKPGTDSPEAKQSADLISTLVDSDIKTEEARKLLGLAFKHLPVYYTGVMKAFWDPEKGKDGDYYFKNVVADNVVFDHTASTNNPDDMSFVAEEVEYSVKEVVMRFPNKEADLYQELRSSGVFTDTTNEKSEIGMGTKFKIWEIWFTWYQKKGKEFERLEGVAWYYKNLVLKKMKNPNWDWEGEEHVFSYDKPIDENALRDQMFSQMMGMMPQMQTQKTFHNHFESPQKPYYFMGYDQWGKQPLDETSIIEQALYLQDNTDKRGKQVTEMLDRARGKHIFSSDSGLKKEDIEELDMANPEEDLLVEGDVKAVHAFIQGEQPSPAAIQDITASSNRGFAIMGVNSTLRGDVQTDVATTNQIAREADFTRADDYVEDTINNAARWRANWIMQFVKLRYTEDHYVRLLGPDGTIAFNRINRDLVDDGQEIIISASGTDKMKAQQKAMDAAKLGVIDPYNFFKDAGYSDPKGRTAALMEFKLNPNAYALQYPSDNNVQAPQMAQMLGQAPVQPGMPPPDMSLAMGEMGQPQQVPAQGNVGPVANANPQPGNTSQIPINPPQQIPGR